MLSFVVLVLVESTFSFMCSGQINKRQFKVANSLLGGESEAAGRDVIAVTRHIY